MGGWLLWESGVYKRAHVPEPSMLTSVSMQLTILTELSSPHPNPHPCFRTQSNMSGKLWPQSLTRLPAGPANEPNPQPTARLRRLGRTSDLARGSCWARAHLPLVLVASLSHQP